MLYKKQLSEMKKRLDELYDAQIRQRRMLTDILYNLDEENMPAIKAIIERYRSEGGESVAALKVQADQNSASISALARVQYEHSESIARIDSEASEDRASISLAVERSASALDTAEQAKEAATDGASIILSVNADGSDAKISADKILLEGVTSFVRPEQLDGSDGVEQTTIDGGNIKTGKISAQLIDAEGLSVGDDVDGAWTMEKDRLVFNGPLSENAWIGFSGFYYSANGACLLEIDRSTLSSAIRSRNAWIQLSSQGISAGTGENSEKLNIGASGGELSGAWYYGSSELATKSDIEDLSAEIEALRAELEGGSQPSEPEEPEEPTESVAAPTFSPSDSVVMYDDVAISCSTPGSIIHYTVSMEYSGETWSGEGYSPTVY
ncbi:MAG: hypothetical protein IKB35_05320, partial [Clostridia bacterium]|nr:hypothetical protein [Clostridia bacterium]